jgi:hypothetical protein
MQNPIIKMKAASFRTLANSLFTNLASFKANSLFTNLASFKSSIQHQDWTNNSTDCRITNTANGLQRSGNNTRELSLYQPWRPIEL